MNAGAQPGTRRFALLLLAVVGLAAAARFGALAAFFPERPIGDEYYYLETATEIARGNGHARGGRSHAAWPPAHSYFLALFIDPDAPPEARRAVPLLRAEAALGTLLVLFIALLGTALFDRRTGLLAGLVAALYPTFVAFSNFIWSETLFLLLLTAALWSAVCVERTRRFAWVVVSGLLFGAAGLTREVAILIAGGVAVWWVTTARAEREAGGESVKRAGLQAVLMLSLAAACILPWTWRNYRLLGRFVPVSSVSWMAIRQGNTFAKDDWTRPPLGRARNFVKEYYADPDEAGRIDRARAEALELIRAEQPTWALKKLVRNTAMLFNPDSFLFKKISRGAYPSAGLGAVRAVLVASVLSYVAVVVAGVIGIAGARGRGRRMLALGVAGIVVALHLLALASPRYRLPILPLLIVFGSHAALHRSELVITRRARWAVALVLAWFLLWCVPYFRADAASLWRQGTYAEAFRP